MNDNHDRDNTIDTYIRLLENQGSDIDEARHRDQPDFSHIQPGATFSPRRGAGPGVKVVKRSGQLVYYAAADKLDFCGAPFFCAQFSLHISETVQG